MSEYLTEEEQLERIKDWWKKYGNRLVIAFLLIVTGFFAWRWWHQHQIELISRASTQFEQLLVYVAQGNREEVQSQAQQLIDESANTVYAQFAAAILARDSVYSGDLDEAVRQLNWVIDHSNNPSIQQISRIRLARVLLEQGEQANALNTLEVIDDDTYMPLINEIRGDIYVNQQAWDEGRQAYIAALSDLPALGINDQVLQMKLNNLPSSDAS